jgi:hypothetical protein
MRSYPTILFLLFALAVGVSPTAFGQVVQPGSCQSGRAERDLDINNVLARMFNTGSLFFGNTTVAGDGYLVPQASGNSPIFASGIWIGGEVDGDFRIAGSTYDRFEFWPGPLNDDGTLPNPADCGDFDRIYKVSRTDIRNFEGGQPPASDLAAWPAELGAPVIAAPGNGIDDDGDGLIDEGTDGIDNDEDGFIDERDEQERVVPEVRQAAGLPIYDLAGGDRPEIIGDQALWWVMNDVGNTHDKNLTPPIGIEVQVLAWSFARADVLNDVTFYRYTVIKKSPGTLESTFFSIFSDPDLGDAADDYIGVDTTLSLAYVYNGTESDAVYGIPPATGYDFFQGPIVDADGDGEVDDTLGITRFNYFSNIGDGPTSDPAGGEDQWNYMQGLWRDGTPMTEGGDGYQTDGPVTLFAFPGDPVIGAPWSEVNEGNAPGDRRFLVTTGPFDLSQGDSQDIVYGIVFAQGSSQFDSITQLRSADRVAQTAFDIDFELASAPPAPPRCSPGSSNPQLQPGSGNCFEAVETDQSAALVWGYPTNSSNYLGRYEELDRLLAGTGVPDTTYNFEAFNIYRYPTSNFSNDDRELIATFDVENEVTTVVDTAFSAEVGQPIAFIDAATLLAEDTGIRYSLDLSQLGLTNYQDYYFGITAYAYSEFSVPKVIESSATTITVRPSNLTAANGGSVAPATIGQVINAERVGGIGEGTFQARVVDPTQITGASYTVEVVEVGGGTSFRILRDDEVVFDGEDVFEMVETSVSGEGVLVMPGDQRLVIDGLEFFQVEPSTVVPAEFDEDATEEGIAAGGAGIIETSFPNAEVCSAGSDDTGCVFEDYLGGNTVWQSPNSAGTYTVTNPDNELGDLEQFIPAAVPEDYEIRFTEECANGGCLGVYSTALPRNNDLITSVPFEIWNVGNARNDFAEDDIRMIPVLRALDGEDPTAQWSDTFPAEQEVIVGEDTLLLPVTQRVLGMMPDRPDGYELFAAAAEGFGGAGGTYLPEEDGDTQVDTLANGQECRRQNYYVDFCYRDANILAVVPLGGLDGLMFSDLDQDGFTPPAGTTVRFITAPKPDLAPPSPFQEVGDRVVFDTAPIQFQTGVQEAAEEALDLIGIVPNPYMGVSAYETDNLDRVVRFINLPERATISIYTVAGTLIRTLQKEGPSRSLDWDLNTHNQLPVASGMYLIHVDVPGVGEKVLKFGVVNRKTRITVF